jgi:hypothetical protein
LGKKDGKEEGRRHIVKRRKAAEGKLWERRERERKLRKRESVTKL